MTNKLKTALTIATFGLLAVTASATPQTTHGTIGTKYVGLDATSTAYPIEGIDNSLGGSFVANIPVMDNLDFIASYDFDRFDDTLRLDSHTANLGVTGYLSKGAFRPFIQATLGHYWQDSKTHWYILEPSENFYTAAIGVESPLPFAGKDTTVTAVIRFVEELSSPYPDYWTYTLGINHWATNHIGVAAAIMFQEQDTIRYSLGIRYRL